MFPAQHLPSFYDEAAAIKMCFRSFPYLFDKQRPAPSSEDKNLPLLEESQQPQSNGITFNLIKVLSIPSFCDLLGTGMQQLGLLFCTVSVFQMLKGSVMFFSAMMSVCFLKRKLVLFHWLGLFICVLGLCCVGMSSVFASKSEQTDNTLSDTLFGIFIILAGQVVCAVQYVIEEFLLKPPNDAPVLALVGIYNSLSNNYFW